MVISHKYKNTVSTIEYIFMITNKYTLSNGMDLVGRGIEFCTRIGSCMTAALACTITRVHYDAVKYIMKGS